MSWRSAARRALPYVVAAALGFLLAYLIVAFVIFPAGIVPTDTRVPSVVGLSADVAETRLKEAGFQMEIGETRVSASVPSRTVMDQTPNGGALERKGTTIVLAVSGGPRLAPVPSVDGMTRSQAEAALESAGFAVGEVTERPDRAPRGQVVETRPAGGTRATLPGPVALVLSAGPSTIDVPDVVGRRVDEARMLLEQVGLHVTRVISQGATDGSSPVVSQSPAPGTSINAGGGVELTVAARP